MSSNRKIILFLVALDLVLLVSCCACLIGGLGYGGWALYEEAQKQVGFMLPAEVPPAVPELSHASLPSDQKTLEALLEANIPIRDLHELGGRLKRLDDVPTVVRETPLPLEIGDQDTFWVADMSDPEDVKYAEASAKLVLISDHAYFWVEDGYDVDMEALGRSADAFDEAYEVNRRVFGEEWSPGIDADPRVHVFNGNVPGVGGYFSGSDEFSSLINPRSNEREMFYISLDNTEPGDMFYDSVLAHEFQHMIHWNIDRNEPSWVNEGLSELATYLNGHTPTDGGTVFPMFGPDTQLNTWDNDPSRSYVHYGASYAFMRYFMYRFGEDAVSAIAADPGDGVVGLSGELEAQGYTFDSFFREWTLANTLNDDTIDEGQYLSPGVSLPMKIDQTHDSYPVERDTAVHQYGTDYVVFEPGDLAGTLRVMFDGANRTRILPATSHSGEMFWYSHRGDSSDMTLTRSVDLSGLDRATLAFWAWYDIERGWDYGYVEISIDDGKTWTILEGPGTTDYNPAGNAFGRGYTGESEGWVEESIDLSDYIGQEVLIRFEYITDDAYNAPGWALDDIAIPELQWSDDAERDSKEWEMQGFARVTNFMPQRFTVQFIAYEADGAITIHDLELKADQTGQWEFEGFGGGVEKVVMVVSGLTPVTTEWAYYQYDVTLE